MSLPDSYLQYPNRRYGMDHDRYRWSILPQRKQVVWPNGAKLALWITTSIEFFPLDQQGKPFKLPGGMVTPYPDLRHFTLREYGNRVGIYRLFRLFDRLNLKSSFAINAKIAERIPALVRDIVARGDEVIAHGLDMDHPLYGGMDVEEERALIRRSLQMLRDATGQAVDGWLSPGKSESLNTPDLLAAEGVRYFCDWINDDMPYRFETANGALVAMPHSGELSDRQILVEFRHAEADFAQQLLDQFHFLRREAEREGGRILALTLHPWVIGQPHRIGALERALTEIAGQAGIWSATGGEIERAWSAQQG